MIIHFFYENTTFELDEQSSYMEWFKVILTNFQKDLLGLNIVFCSDEYLLDINQKYLQHDYFTDVITFDHSENEKEIEGDVYISIDRVRENAAENKVPFENELSRVMAHGLLHLIGFQDKTPEQKASMREKEDACLSLQKS